MLNFFSMVGVPLSLMTVIVGHGTALCAITVTNVFARLQRFDRRIEEASADLGATPLKTFWHVTLPNIRSAIIGSALISFTLSFDEIPVTYFLTGRDNTLPMYIWSTIRRGITPEINAIGSVIIVGSIALLLVSVFIMSEPSARPRLAVRSIPAETTIMGRVAGSTAARALAAPRAANIETVHLRIVDLDATLRERRFPAP